MKKKTIALLVGLSVSLLTTLVFCANLVVQTVLYSPFEGSDEIMAGNRLSAVAELYADAFYPAIDEIRIESALSSGLAFGKYNSCVSTKFPNGTVLTMNNFSHRNTKIVAGPIMDDFRRKLSLQSGIDTSQSIRGMNEEQIYRAVFELKADTIDLLQLAEKEDKVIWIGYDVGEEIWGIKAQKEYMYNSLNGVSYNRIDAKNTLIREITILSSFEKENEILSRLGLISMPNYEELLQNIGNDDFEPRYVVVQDNGEELNKLSDELKLVAVF